MSWQAAGLDTCLCLLPCTHVLDACLTGQKWWEVGVCITAEQICVSLWSGEAATVHRALSAEMCESCFSANNQMQEISLYSCAACIEYVVTFRHK